MEFSRGVASANTSTILAVPWPPFSSQAAATARAAALWPSPNPAVRMRMRRRGPPGDPEAWDESPVRCRAAAGVKLYGDMGRGGGGQVRGGGGHARLGGFRDDEGEVGLEGGDNLLPRLRFDREPAGAAEPLAQGGVGGEPHRGRHQ